MELRDLAVAIVTSEEARERDRLAIEAGTPSIQLMRAAGVAAARRIEHHFRNLMSGGVQIYTGAGNNGGDGWVVAAELAARGVPVQVIEVKPAQSADAVTVRSEALALDLNPNFQRAAIIVDALLGTGTKGGPTGEIRNAVDQINQRRREGSKVVALDIPTGLDATTGEMHDSVLADLTLSFGSAKRGHLISRQVCGTLEILDIGLGEFGRPSHSDIRLASRDWISEHTPAIPADAHKGTRKRLAIIAGAKGMGGAAILAGRGALRSGIGLLHVIVARENRDAIHAAIPAALVSSIDELIEDAKSVLGAADAVVVGPGLDPDSAQAVLSAIRSVNIPAVIDAGALTATAHSRTELKQFCNGREVVLTPHPAEMSRLADVSTANVLARRFEIGAELAADTGSTVLLKGTPTIISHPAHGRIATATGNSSLATGGSGDVLSGMIGTLLAQTGSGFDSAVCAAWVHGRAAEICGNGRGISLDDILFAMPAAWRLDRKSEFQDVLASLPSVQ